LLLLAAACGSAAAVSASDPEYSNKVPQYGVLLIGLDGAGQLYGSLHHQQCPHSVTSAMSLFCCHHDRCIHLISLSGKTTLLEQVKEACGIRRTLPLEVKSLRAPFRHPSPLLKTPCGSACRRLSDSTWPR
jgi:hypothetical protein